LRYFFDLFLKYPDNPINYEVRYERRFPNDLDGKVIEEYDRTLGNMTWMKILLFDLKHLLIYKRKDAIRIIRKIRKCLQCNQFFIAAKDNPRQKYCPACSTKDHTPKEEKAKRMREIYRPNYKKLQKEHKRRALYDFQYMRLKQSGYSDKDARIDSPDQS